MQKPFENLCKQRAWQLDRNRRGLCQGCGAEKRWRKPDGSLGVFCLSCRARHNAAKNAKNAERRNAALNAR